MAAPLVALPALGKIGAALKGLLAAKKIAGAAGAAKQLTIPGLTAATKTAAATAGKQGILGNVKRYAGDMMTDYLGGKPTVRNLAENFGLDAAFGVYAGFNEPGDLGDKVIRGLATAGSGGLGGAATTVGLSKLTGKMPTGFARQATEFGGAMLGDQVGYSIADSLQRAKNSGLTAWEQEALRQEMEMAYGQGGDPFLYEQGLG